MAANAIKNLRSYFEGYGAEREDVSVKLVLEKIDEYEAREKVKSSNCCEECSKELEAGTVFCSDNCRIHYVFG